MTVAFVQFPHPGEEQVPQPNMSVGDIRPWSIVDHPHGRKFVSVFGTYQAPMLGVGSPIHNRLWAWIEWEADARLIHRFPFPESRQPEALWRPIYIPTDDYWGLHNTDPFIFDGFYYANCGQIHVPELRDLEPGSVIMFGSKLSDTEWVLDTVLVVKSRHPHTGSDWEDVITPLAPDILWHATLNAYVPYLPSLDMTFYVGATALDPIDGMYSFFPCVPYYARNPFARPTIVLPDAHMDPTASRRIIGADKDIGTVATKALWESLVQQVQEAGLFLGTSATIHKERR